MTSVRAVVADDHPLFREGLQNLLEDLGVVVVASVSDGGAAVDAVRAHDPDVVLMDLRMPVLSGAEATARVTRDHPRTAVLVLTMSEDAASLQAALRAGARGYLLKEASKEDVANTLDAVLRGHVVIGAGAASRVRQVIHSSGVDAFPLLTEREADVLRLMAGGLDNHAIAGRLFLAEKTVRNRVSGVLAKLQVSTRAEAIAAARDAGIGGSTTSS